MDDPRFSHVATDPRFKAIPRRARKVRIDPRFRSMFTEKRFKVNYKVDKRGKKLKTTSSDDLKKYYELADQSANGTDSANLKPEDNGEENLSSGSANAVGPSSSGSNKDRDSAESSSSSDSEDDAEESDSTDIDADALLDVRDQITHRWGEEAEGEIDRSDATSCRLAVCGMDWDRISAHDLLVLLGSFRPQGGIVKSVAIYPSDFGQERMATEDIQGPAELIEESEEEETVEGKGYAQEKLRQYQMNRLQYFYAIVECDSSATAAHIYDQCDGMEYERSASKLDLRFVPDDVTFDDREPKSVATETSLPSDYAPSLFFTSALQQSKVNLTWDETDPHRLGVTMRKFGKEELLDLDYSAYLASSGSDDDNPKSLGGGEEADQIKKYRALLDDGAKPAVERENGELEITWNVGLQEVGKRILKDREGLSGAARKDRQKRKKETEKTEDVGEKDLGFDDPFFLGNYPRPGAKKKSKKPAFSQEELRQHRREREELELLVMSDSEEAAAKEHFSLRGLLASSEGRKKESAGKRGRKKRKTEMPRPSGEGRDAFKMDHDDPRFSALYESHLYAVDPSDPHYKPTSGMKDVVVERQRRRARQHESSPGNDTTTTDPTSADPSIGALVKSVKAKSTALLSKKRK